MVIFYGLDHFLLTKAVTDYLRNLQTNDNLNDHKFVVNYYLEPEALSTTFAVILNEISKTDLFVSKKIIIINDYHLVLNNNHEEFLFFFNKIKEFSSNIVIFKILTNNLKLKDITKVQTYFINQYDKEQLKLWIINKSFQYQIEFTKSAILKMISLLPNSLSIIDNELKKFQNFKKIINEELVAKIISRYFDHNPYKLISYWLNNNYYDFFFDYYQYWEKVNYEKTNLFLIAVYQLELMRNIKILASKKVSLKIMIEKLKVSLNTIKSLLACKKSLVEINYLLIHAHELDIKIKSGKIAKNLAIDLFFCNI